MTTHQVDDLYTLVLISDRHPRYGLFQRVLARILAAPGECSTKLELGRRAEGFRSGRVAGSRLRGRSEGFDRATSEGVS